MVRSRNIAECTVCAMANVDEQSKHIVFQISGMAPTLTRAVLCTGHAVED
jgi:hypothetical protein